VPSAPAFERSPRFPGHRYSSGEVRLEVSPEPGRVLAQIALQIGHSLGFVAGAKAGWRGPVESNPVEAPAAEDVGDVLSSHVFFNGRRQGRVDLEGDFIEEHGWPFLVV
jgi:hypothetical protein